MQQDIYDNYRYKIIDSIDIDDTASCITLNAKCNFIIVGLDRLYSQNNLILIYLDTQKRIILKGHHKKVNSTQCLKSGRHFYSAGDDQTVKTWMINKNRKWILSRSSNVHHRKVIDLRVNSSETQLFSLDICINLILWQIQKTGELNAQKQLTFCITEKLCYIPNRSMDICQDSILAYSGFAQIHVWKCNNSVWKETQILKDDNVPIYLLNIQVKTRNIFTTSFQKNIKIWAIHSYTDEYFLSKCIITDYNVMTIDFHQNETSLLLITMFINTFFFAQSQQNQQLKQLSEIEGRVQQSIFDENRMIYLIRRTVKITKIQ